MIRWIPLNVGEKRKWKAAYCGVGSTLAREKEI
jgi:hypothetical protein